MDNLQSVTYQTFEQDPVKYRNYEEVHTNPASAPEAERVAYNFSLGYLPGIVRMAQTRTDVSSLILPVLIYVPTSP